MMRNNTSLTPQGRNDQSMSLRDAMGKLFDESFWAPFGDSLFPEIEQAGGIFPRVDISETDSAIELRADVPGIDPDDVAIEVRDGMLTISGKTAQEDETQDDDKTYYRYERHQGAFSRSFRLPTTVDADSISAESDNGVITVTIPKTKESRGKKIEIKK